MPWVRRGLKGNHNPVASTALLDQSLQVIFLSRNQGNANGHGSGQKRTRGDERVSISPHGGGLIAKELAVEIEHGPVIVAHVEAIDFVRRRCEITTDAHAVIGLYRIAASTRVTAYKIVAACHQVWVISKDIRVARKIH